MANTLATAERQILASALKAYVAEGAPLAAFSLDADGGTPGQAVGNTVLVKVAAARAAINGAFTTYETGDTVFTDVTVTLNNRSRCSFHLTDLEAGQHAFNAAEAAGIEAAGAVGRNVFDNVSGIWTDTSFGSNAGSSYLASVAVAAFDADDAVTIGTYMDTNNVPQSNRSLILTPAAHGALKKDNALQNADASGTTMTLREGVTGRIDRFDVYMTNAINSTPLDGGNVYAFAAHSTAMAVATRTIPPSDSDIATSAGLRYGEMTDPGTGLTLGMRSWYNTATGTRWGAFECLSGRAVAKANGMYRAKTIA